MSLLSDHKLAQSNARMYLMLIYRELREVLHSDLCTNEKRHLFKQAHRNDILGRVWLLAPEKYETPGCVADTFAEPWQCDGEGEVRLRNYLATVGELLNYRELRAALLLAVDELLAIDLDSFTDARGRQNKLAHHGNNLRTHFDALRLKPSHTWIDKPDQGYVGSLLDHQKYVQSMADCAAAA